MKSNKIKGIFARERVMAEDNPISRQLYQKSRFGEQKGGKFNYSLSEALFLMESRKMNIYDGRNSKLNEEEFTRKARKAEPHFWIRFAVFRDLRRRGHIVKTALKFGADFRVYDKGIKPGQDHAKWIVFPVYEADSLTWYDFSAKNRVSHATRKSLLIAVVDDEQDVTYYEVNWKRP
tara:strand:- start:2421 stop:2951 length:531 start_codon:yes stop_codon:yes gene_type:complete